MSPSQLQPFVLTLSLDPRTANSLTALRTKYFPAHRNHLSSHLTYFHALPAVRKSDIVADLSHLASVTKSFEITIGPPFMMGAGVGINIKSAQEKRIEAIHDKLLRRWTSTEVELTGQDKRKLSKPHATVMNKCSKEEADACYKRITKTWKDRKGKAVGLQLWEYQKDGSWKFLLDFDFQAGLKGRTEENLPIDMANLKLSTSSKQNDDSEQSDCSLPSTTLKSSRMVGCSGQQHTKEEGVYSSERLEKTARSNSADKLPRKSGDHSPDEMNHSLGRKEQATSTSEIRPS